MRTRLRPCSEQDDENSQNQQSMTEKHDLVVWSIVDVLDTQRVFLHVYSVLLAGYRVLIRCFPAEERSQFTQKSAIAASLTKEPGKSVPHVSQAPRGD
jgi:hypothetical protein